MRDATESYVRGYSQGERQRPGYTFGALPVLLRASLDSALLPVHRKLLGARSWTRACVRAICGGFASWLWFLEWLGIAWNIYGLVGSVVMAALSLYSRVSRAMQPASTDPAAIQGRYRQRWSTSTKIAFTSKRVAQYLLTLISGLRINARGATAPEFMTPIVRVAVSGVKSG